MPAAPKPKEESSSEEEDFRMKKPEPKVVEAALGVSSVLGKRMDKIKSKIKQEIEERKQREIDALLERGPQKKNKKKKSRKRKKVAEVEEDDKAEEDREEEKKKEEAPKPANNEALRDKFKAIYEKMRRADEDAASLTRLPGVNEGGEEQVGLIIRKKRPKKADSERSVRKVAVAPRRSTIGPAIVPPSDGGNEDNAQWQDTTWVPPSGQNGDGRTHLNAKFGY
uniref:Uncharacterized protein n=1 Tax=Lotharella oceanica TaxID=641309 RepID=A0A7S2XF17_9EUKA